MRVATISDFRANVRSYVDDVIKNSGSVVINRGNTAAVLISLDEYNSIKSTERIMDSERLSSRVEEGLDELKANKGIEVDINEL